MYTVERNNLFQAGSTSVNPGLTCTDEDSVAGVEPLTYAVKTSAYSNMFTISSSGMLTFAQDFDLDAGSMPSSLTLTIACLDDEGASATAQLLVTITVSTTYQMLLMVFRRMKNE